MVESYVRMAKRIKEMSDAAFFSEFGELHRVIQHITAMTVDQAASGILDLYKRHATEVCDVITKGIEKHAQDNLGWQSPEHLFVDPGLARRVQATSHV